MRLSISNIAWPQEYDRQVYGLMNRYGYTGLEIAPTRIFPEKPYERLSEAKAWSKEIKETYGLQVSSMQSIWFGRQEKLFGTEQERRCLVDYTKKAVDFARVIGCRNLVFGCPRNRNLPAGEDPERGIAFFREIGDYAAEHGVVIGLEANPPIYQTNYINDTFSALELIRQVDSEGFQLNLDVGTMVENQEETEGLRGHVDRISHVHISEPGLRPVERRQCHRELGKLLKQEGYEGYISIEMGKTEDMGLLEEIMRYTGGIFGECL